MEEIEKHNFFLRVFSPPVINRSDAKFLAELHHFLNDDDPYIYDDKKWICATVYDWAKQIVSYNGGVRKSIKRLKNLGIIHVDKLSKNKTDRDDYYTIDYEKLEQILSKIDKLKKNKWESKKKIKPDLIEEDAQP